MSSIHPELSLDFRPTFAPKTISDILKGILIIGDVSERESKLNDFVKRLEEEMKKIDAFKRELPFCMLLINDAILAVKEGLLQCTVPKSKPHLEEFIPWKKSCDENQENKQEKDCTDKKNWMSSVQLWNTDDNPTTNSTYLPNQTSELETKRKEEQNHIATEDSLQSCKNNGGGRPFLPFKAYTAFPTTLMAVRKEENQEVFPIHGLSLLSPGIHNPREESASTGSRSSGTRTVSSAAANVQTSLRAGPQPQPQPQPQPSRKQRRCWSPELHRRFVNALQQLGGPQVATPKQIRELMQVDGLTNDEVKSHLQKYRLHTRRPPSTTATPRKQSEIVLGGGLWMSQDQCGDSSKGSSSQSGSPQGPLQLTRTGTSITGGQSMEDDEDAKSESYSWRKSIS